MPKTIDPLKYQAVKRSRLQLKSKSQSLRDAGYSENTIKGNISKDNRLLKTIDKEILSEAQKRGIIDKAWKVLENDLDHPKYQHSAALTISSKDMTDKKEVNNLHPDKIIISYTKDTQPVKDKEVTTT